MPYCVIFPEMTTQSAERGESGPTMEIWIESNEVSEESKDTKEGNMNGDSYANDPEESSAKEAHVDHKHFRVDYCQRGSTKCKACKKNIPKDELRIGKMVLFKSCSSTM